MVCAVYAVHAVRCFLTPLPFLTWIPVKIIITSKLADADIVLTDQSMTVHPLCFILNGIVQVHYKNKTNGSWTNQLQLRPKHNNIQFQYVFCISRFSNRQLFTACPHSTFYPPLRKHFHIFGFRISLSAFRNSAFYQSRIQQPYRRMQQRRVWYIDTVVNIFQFVEIKKTSDEAHT